MYVVNGKRRPTVNWKGIYGFFDEYRFLSNFHLSELIVQGTRYPSSEHAYQAMKVISSTTRRRIARIESPAHARTFGQTVILRPDWDSIKVEKMEAVLRCKFLQNDRLRTQLLATNDLYLEETNDWGETYWGVCNDVGHNHLGKLLMQLRAQLR